MPLTKQYLRYEATTSFGVICSRKTGSLLLKVARKGAERLVAVSPALEHVIIWDIKTGDKLGVLAGEDHEVTSLCYHKESSMLAAGYENGSIKLWDIESHDCHMTFSGHKSAVLSLSFDATGTKLVSGGKDTDVIIWDIVNESGLYRLKGHKGPVTCCCFMDNCNVLITCSKDTLMKLWDLDTQHCFLTITDHRSEIWSVALIRDGTRLVTMSSDVELRVYELKLPAATEESALAAPVACTMLGSLKRGSRSRPLCLKVDGEYLVVMSSDFSVELYSIQSETEIEKKRKKRIKNLKKKLKASGNEWVEPEVEFSLEDELVLVHTFKSSNKMKSCDFIRAPDGIIKLLISLHSNMLELHSLSIGSSSSSLSHSVSIPGHRSDIRTVCISSDGNLIVSGSSDMIKIWNYSTRQCLHTLSTGYIVITCFVPGDRHLLAGTKSGDVLLYEISSGSLLDTFQAHSGPVWALGVAPNRRGFATGSADHDVKFWEFELTSDEDNGRKTLTAAHVKTLKMSEDVLCLKYSPNDKLFAISLLDSTVKIFFVDTLKFFLSLYGHKLPVLCMDISHDSTLLITGSADKNIRIWGLDFGDCHRSIFGHDDSIMSIQFIPNTHLCFTVSKDRTIKYWDADHYEHIQTLKGHQSEIWACAVSTDGNSLVTGSHDLSLRIWECTREPLVLSEEKENEREMEFESAIAEGGEPVIPGEQEQSEVGMAGRKTIGSMKSAECILEALEIWREETAKMVEYEEECKLTKKKLPLPAVHPILEVSGNCKPEKYVLNVVKKVKSSDLEETLLVLPFSDMVDLLKLCDVWAGHGWEVELTCRCILFLVRVHYHQITSTKLLLPIIESLRENIPRCVESLRDLYGFNLAGLRHLRNVESDKSSSDTSTLFTDVSQQTRHSRNKKRSRVA